MTEHWNLFAIQIYMVASKNKNTQTSFCVHFNTNVSHICLNRRLSNNCLLSYKAV